MRHATADLRVQLDKTLRPFVLGGSGSAGTPMTERRVAETARDAAAAVLPLLGSPPRSAHRVRTLITPLLVCGWAEFDALYDATLDRLVALPPAIPGVDDPPWDAGLAPPIPAKRRWLDDGQWRAPSLQATDVTAPGGTVGRVVHRGPKTLLISEDGRSIRMHSRCECGLADRRSRSEVPYELVHLRRDGSVLDVTMGTACGGCRAPIN